MLTLLLLMFFAIARGSISIDREVAKKGWIAMVSSDRSLGSINPKLYRDIERSIIDALSGMIYDAESLALAFSALEEEWRTGIRVNWRSAPRESLRITDVRVRTAIMKAIPVFAESITGGKDKAFVSRTSDMIKNKEKKY